MRIAVIGAGISGLSIAKLLKETADVVIFESADRPGGLIKCERVDGHLFHRTGGHVFNTKNQQVLNWFWSQFDREKEFIKADRNASVVLSEQQMIPYPIENHVYLLDSELQKSFVEDLLSIAKGKDKNPDNFEEFLLVRFGKTLYELYFKPYNFKVWRQDLSKVPLTWLDGKLPMPTLSELIYNNMNRVEEKTFVHSTFFYPKVDGSQFIANRLAEDLTIRYNSKITRLKKMSHAWIVNDEQFDKVIFCGNIKQLPQLLTNQLDISDFTFDIESLQYHGTTSVFCEIQQNPFSWLYLPSSNHEAHRIICTGNFAESNNLDDKMTGTIEFTDNLSKENILSNLKRIPFSPKYLTHHYEQYTYPIQDAGTRLMIRKLKHVLEKNQLYLLGRFAEWEYYNMDVAIGAAMSLSKIITK
jgi:protoporphyrinogen oxidase